MSNGRDKPKSSVKLEDVAFYFDGVERDRLDAAGMSRKSGEVLALRERLLKLLPAEFDVVIKTLKQLIEDKPATDADAAQAKQRARTFYDNTRPSGSSSSSSDTKVSAT